jgi:hypothetical protein
MRYTLTPNACTLHREPGDRALSHESTTAYHLKRLLNADGYRFTRMNPSQHGLTSCRVGLWDKRAGIILWHERYAIEAAHKAFNAGKVSFMRVAMEK